MDALYPAQRRVYGVGLVGRGPVADAYREYYVYGLGYRFKPGRVPPTVCEWCGRVVSGDAVVDVLYSSKVALVFYRCPGCGRLLARYVPVSVEVSAEPVAEHVVEAEVAVEAAAPAKILGVLGLRRARVAGVPAARLSLTPPGLGVFLPLKYVEWLAEGWRIDYVDPYNTYISLGPGGRAELAGRLRDQYPVKLPRPYRSPVVFAHRVRARFTVPQSLFLSLKDLL